MPQALHPRKPSRRRRQHRGLTLMAMAELPLAAQPLLYRCTVLTGSFETGALPPQCFAGLAGDFDGQGLSFGALQWNLGQGTLQPLLQDLARNSPGMMAEIFGSSWPELRAVLQRTRAEQLQWARTIQGPKPFVIQTHWKEMFRTLGLREECQQVQVEAAAQIFQRASRMRRDYALRSERGLALLFDILVQNGGINLLVKKQILADFAGLPTTSDWRQTEVERLRSIARRRAEASRPEFVKDVLVRKMTIAEGQGTIHEIAYRLDEQFGIRLEEAG